MLAEEEERQASISRTQQLRAMLEEEERRLYMLSQSRESGVSGATTVRYTYPGYGEQPPMGVGVPSQPLQPQQQMFSQQQQQSVDPQQQVGQQQQQPQQPPMKEEDS